jgi:hypothetical protein
MRPGGAAGARAAGTVMLVRRPSALSRQMNR